MAVVAGRGDHLTQAARGVEFLVLAVPDAVVADVADAVAPELDAVVVHLAGALTLDVLAPHQRRASVHPLVALTGGDEGAARLRGAWMAVAGDPAAMQLVDALNGRPFAVADADRVRYHAAAVVASNHVVALLGQVERLAAGCGLALEPFLALTRGAIDDVAAHGPAAALTGPVSRGDWDTVNAHVAALPEDEREAYLALASAAARLVPAEAAR